MKTVHRFACVVLPIAAIALSGCPVPIAGQTRTFDGIEFQWCPPGCFTMGSPEDEVGRQPDETLHKVTLCRGFWMSKYEVTQAQWVELMGSNPSFELNVGDNRPVNVVDWYDVQDYLTMLNAATKHSKYRLPSEAEWEYACRAGTQTRFYWDDDPDYAEIDQYCWYDANSNIILQPVGEKEPNNWGLHDMGGNALEWCQDWFDEYPTDPVTDPQGPESGAWKIIRGGSYLDEAYYCRSAARYVAPPDDADAGPGLYLMMGFRLVREANPCRDHFPPPRFVTLPFFRCRPYCAQFRASADGVR